MRTDVSCPEELVRGRVEAGELRLDGDVAGAGSAAAIALLATAKSLVRILLICHTPVGSRHLSDGHGARRVVCRSGAPGRKASTDQRTQSMHWSMHWSMSRGRERLPAR
eukprot:2442961-Prymnesium_polylepis.1